MTAKKKQKLRNNEYYSTQQIYDELYDKSKKGTIFTNLLQHIQSENNVRLAYRNLKKNKGSKTPGTNRTIIDNIADEKIILLLGCISTYFFPQFNSWIFNLVAIILLLLDIIEKPKNY